MPHRSDTAVSDAQQRDAPEGSRGSLVSIVAATGVGLGGSTAMPQLLGALIDGRGLEASAAGLLGSLELGMVAIASLLVAPRVGRTSRLGLALGGAALAALGHLASAAADSYALLAVARLVAGCGAGLALAAGNATVAAAADPDRLYARVSVLGGLAAAVLLLLLPYAIVPLGWRGGYLALGAVCLVLAPLLRGLPAAPVTSTVRAPDAPHRLLGLGTLAALLLFSLGEGSVWSFTERIGAHTGLPLVAIGRVLGLATVVGLAGAALAAWLGTRAGRSTPLLVGVLGFAVSTFALGYVHTPTAYVVLLLGWSLSFFFALPYLMGTAAALDRRGGWTAAAAGIMTVGIGLGPAVGGTLLAVGGFAGLSWLVGGSCLAGLALVIPVTLILDRHARAPRSAPGA